MNRRTASQAAATRCIAARRKQFKWVEWFARGVRLVETYETIVIKHADPFVIGPASDDDELVYTEFPFRIDMLRSIPRNDCMTFDYDKDDYVTVDAYWRHRFDQVLSEAMAA